METDKIYDEVLIRYLLNETDTAEELLVEEWAGKEVNNRLYLESLAGTLKLVAVNDGISRIDANAEWQHFQQLKSSGHPIASPVMEMSPENVEVVEEIPVRNNAKIYRLLISGAVAASIIIILLFKTGLFKSGKTDQLAGVKTTTVQNDSLHSGTVHENNTTTHIRSFNLPDGSVINLYPKSDLAYHEPADGRSRQVTLSGKADFGVAKNPLKPFTVYSGPISTTVLGTQFTITSIPGEKNIYVRLNEGKVVVKAEKVVNNKKMKDVYLVPGQELVYNIRKGTSKVRLFEKPDTKDHDKYTSDNLVIPTGSKQSWFMFNNQSLSSIFSSLEDMYESKIDYSKVDISKMYFIGTFNKSDSLEFILKQIATINNLEVSRDNNTYTIKKK